MPRAGRINDREPRIPEYDIATLDHTLVIRPAMPLRLVHPRHDLTRAVP